MDTLSSAEFISPPNTSIPPYHGGNNNEVYHSSGSIIATDDAGGDDVGFRWPQPHHHLTQQSTTTDGGHTFHATQQQDHHRLIHQQQNHSSSPKIDFKLMEDGNTNRYPSTYNGRQESMVASTDTSNNSLFDHQSQLSRTASANLMDPHGEKSLYSMKDRIEGTPSNQTSKYYHFEQKSHPITPPSEVYGNNNTFPTNLIPKFNNTTPVKDETETLPQNISCTHQQQQQQGGGVQENLENNSEEEATKKKVQLMMQQQHPSTSIAKLPESSQILSKEKDKSKDSGAMEMGNENSLKTDPSTVQDNGLPSYTAMIAQAILKKETSKSTLSDIYEYMEKYFPSLEKRGTGWRNCVRHTLSLNDCFIKLHRPENGRSCNWAIHPTYHESFSKGDYRKRRALRKRPRGLQWIDPALLTGYQFGREHGEVYGEMHHHHHQPQSPYYHHYPPHAHHPHPSSPQSYYHHPPSGNYNNQNNYAIPSPSQQHFQQQPQHHQQQQQPQQHPQQSTINNLAPSHHQNHHHQQTSYMTAPQTHHPSHTNTNTHHHNLPNEPHCTNPDCHCQYSRQMFNRVYTP